MFMTSQPRTCTPVVHDPAAARSNAIGSVVCFLVGIGGLALFEHWIIGWISLFALIIAAGLLYSCLKGSYKADCPACGETIEELYKRKNKSRLCKHCRNFLEGDGGELWAIEESRVAKKPIFYAPLPEEFVFPDVCCVCGGPPTRYNTLKSELLHGASAVTIVGGRVVKKKITLEGIPHCDQHKKGVAIEMNHHIHFRSYAYLRAFCAANRVQPGDSGEWFYDRCLDVPALTDMLLDDKNPGMRKSAAEGLRSKGLSAMEAVPALMEALRDEDEGVREAAYQTLKELKPDELRDSLNAAVSATDAEPVATENDHVLASDEGDQAEEPLLITSFE